MSDPETESVIVVNGHRPREADGGSGGGGSAIPSHWYSRASGSGGGGGYVNGDGGTVNDNRAEDVIIVEVNLPDPTPDQIRAIDRLVAGIRQALADLRSLPGTHYLRLPNGAKIEVSELLRLLTRATFLIKPVGTTYGNQTTRGEADDNDGYPQISLNIDVVQGYTTYASGGYFMVMYEIAHTTKAMIAYRLQLELDGYSFDEDDLYERTTNDIAKAVLAISNQPHFPATVPTPGAPGFSSDLLIFAASGLPGGEETPPPDTPGPTDPGDGHTPQQPQ